jgi:hypothetical protein
LPEGFCNLCYRQPGSEAPESFLGQNGHAEEEGRVDSEPRKLFNVVDGDITLRRVEDGRFRWYV